VHVEIIGEKKSVDLEQLSSTPKIITSTGYAS